MSKRDLINLWNMKKPMPISLVRSNPNHAIKESPEFLHAQIKMKWNGLKTIAITNLFIKRDLINKWNSNNKPMSMYDRWVIFNLNQAKKKWVGDREVMASMVGEDATLMQELFGKAKGYVKRYLKVKFYITLHYIKSLCITLN